MSDQQKVKALVWEWQSDKFLSALVSRTPVGVYFIIEQEVEEQAVVGSYECLFNPDPKSDWYDECHQIFVGIDVFTKLEFPNCKAAALAHYNNLILSALDI